VPVDREHFIDQFEEAWQSRGPVPIEKYLPPRNHPHYQSVLAEMIRVELEYRWKDGRPLPLEQYRDRFPDAFADEAIVQGIAYEAGQLQAVCMPYCGATTLGHVVRAVRERPALPTSGRELHDIVRARPRPNVAGIDGPPGAKPNLEEWQRLEPLSYVNAVLRLA